jgi:hypothetical protein
MTLDDHKRWLERGTLLACLGLAASIVVQALMGADFHGLPFLAFGLIVGTLGASLLVRNLWKRFASNRN